MNRTVSYLTVSAVGVLIGAAAIGIPQRLEIDLLRAEAIRSSAREAKQSERLAAVLDLGRRLDSADWQAGMTHTACSAARAAAEELLKMARERKKPISTPVPTQPPQNLSPPNPAPVKRTDCAVALMPNPTASEGNKTVSEISIDKQLMVDTHNAARRNVGSPDLVWSATLAGKAQDWAMRLAKDGCKMYHSGNGYGENIYWAGPMVWSDGRRELKVVAASRPVESWIAEKEWYDGSSNTCSSPADKSCGHYTQVVRKGTEYVGCGVAVCGNKAQIWVCNYSPAGNMAGEKPF